MIYPGETEKSGASRSVPALSLTLTLVPASVVGSGVAVALAVVVAKPCPKLAAMAAAVGSVPVKLAAEMVVMARGATLPPRFKIVPLSPKSSKCRAPPWAKSLNNSKPAFLG